MACLPRGCGCTFQSESLSIVEAGGVVTIEQAEISDITALQDDVAALQAAMTVAQADIVSLEGDVAAAEAAVGALQQVYVTTSPTAGANMTAMSARFVRIPAVGAGLDLVLMTVCTATNSGGGAMVNGQTIMTIPSGFRPAVTRRLGGYISSSGNNDFCALLANTGAMTAVVGGAWLAPGAGLSFGLYSAIWETTNPTP